MTYRIFTRRWWRPNKDWPNGLEPCPGKQRTIGRADTEEEAIAACEKWNERAHVSKYDQRLGLKAEFTLD